MGITDPAEEYFKDGLWGWATSVWEKLVSSGGLLFTALHGYDGSAWRKLALVWGYSDVYGEWEQETNVSAGNNTLTFSTVGAGEIWVVTGFSAFCAQTNITRVELRASVGGTAIRIKQAPYGTANQTVDWAGVLVLKEGDELTVLFTACSLNDDIFASAWGYKMSIAN